MPQIFKILEFQDSVGDTMAVRLPPDGDAVIEWGSQLVVREGQTALFLKDGQLAAAFNPGRYTLTTQNIPVLTKFVTGLVFGSGNTPFKAEVFFVGRHLFRDLRWGTPEPIYIPDPVMQQISIRAHGRFAVQVSDPAIFVTRMLGTRGQLKTADLETYLREQYLVSALTDGIASLGRPMAEIARYYRELGQGVKGLLATEFATLGLELTDLSVNAVTPTEDIAGMIADSAKITSQGFAKARATQFDLEARAAGAAALQSAGTSYRDVGTTDALKIMAEKGGGGAGGDGSGGAMGAGMQLGVTMATAQMMRDALLPQGATGPAIAASGSSPVAATTPVAAISSTEAVARIKQLKELLDMGAITQGEFDTKKAELLKMV